VAWLGGQPQSQKFCCFVRPGKAYSGLAGRPTSITEVLLICPSRKSMCYAGHNTRVIIQSVTLP